MVAAIKSDYKQDYIPDARFTHTIFLLNLQKSDYPFGKNDLSLDEWRWLSEMKSAIEQKQIKEIRNRK